MTSDASDGRPRSRPTLSDVATMADVSISTVSKVLNGRSGVSQENRDRIEALLQNHQYNRRNLKDSVAPLIEVLCYEIDSPFACEVLASIESVVRKRHFGMVLSGAADNHVPERQWVEGVLRRQPLGVILVAASLPAKDRKRLQSRDIPLVMVDPAGDLTPDVPSIGSADWNGGYLATRHLLDLGHRRIAIITGPDNMLASTARLSGYRAALDSADIATDPSLVRPGEFHHRDGLTEGLALLSRADRPTAIFASSDLYALGVYEAARSLGLAIPGDVSVVGYDDLHIAQWAGPPLTTIHVPLGAMAEQAVRLIMRQRDEPGLTFARIDIATSLVVRESTAAPAAQSVKSQRRASGRAKSF